MIDFIKDLVVVQQEVQIGEPNKIMGLIKESNKVVRALKNNFERMTERFNPKKARMARSVDACQGSCSWAP
jgi:hypothetical protein